MSIDISCYWKRHGRAPCNTWLDGRTSKPPDRVCYDVALASVEEFARCRFVVSRPLDGDYCNLWPLPVGTQAILDAAREEQDLWGEDAVRWFIQPTLEQSDALVGLAAKRVFQGGHVWLLGLVKPHTLLPEINAALDELEKTHEMDGPLSKRLRELWHDERELRKPGNWTYRFSDAAIVMEGELSPVALHEMERLTKWYQSVVLGLTVTGFPSQLDDLRTKEVRDLLQGIDPALAKSFEGAWNVWETDLSDATRQAVNQMRHVLCATPRVIIDQFIGYRPAPDHQCERVRLIAEKLARDEATKVSLVNEAKSFRDTYKELCAAHSTGEIGRDRVSPLLFRAQDLLHLLLDSIALESSATVAPRPHH